MWKKWENLDSRIVDCRLLIVVVNLFMLDWIFLVSFSLERICWIVVSFNSFNSSNWSNLLQGVIKVTLLYSFLFGLWKNWENLGSRIVDCRLLIVVVDLFILDWIFLISFSLERIHWILERIKWIQIIK